MKIELSVVVCTYNRKESLRECLQALVGQGGVDMEVVIVDGGSDDGSDEVIERFGDKLRIKLVVEEEPELALARDRGWREASGEVVAWIDDDVVVGEGWARSLMEVFESDERVGGVSGPTIIPGDLLRERDVFRFYNQDGEVKGVLGKIWAGWFLEGRPLAVGKIFRSGAWSPGSNFKSSLEIEGLVEVDYLEACNMALRRELVEKVGGFDLGFGGTAEWCELDVARRVAELGYRLVFSSKVRVEHKVSRRGVFKRRLKVGERMRNFLKFYFRHVFKWRFDYMIRFGSYLMFLMIYWSYLVLKNMRGRLKV